MKDIFVVQRQRLLPQGWRLRERLSRCPAVINLSSFPSIFAMRVLLWLYRMDVLLLWYGRIVAMAVLTLRRQLNLVINTSTLWSSVY